MDIYKYMQNRYIDKYISISTYISTSTSISTYIYINPSILIIALQLDKYKDGWIYI